MRIAEDLRLADGRVTEWFRREQARQERGKEPAPAAPSVPAIITISRQYGAGGRTLAGQIAACLGDTWQVWDKELVDAIAQEAQVRTRMIETMDERTRSWMDDMFLNAFGAPVMETGAYKRHLAQVLLALAQQGRKILVGRGANFVLSGALNIRLRASLEYRIQETAKAENLSRDEALKKINRIDHERAAFTRSLFEKDIDDPAGYDMVLQVDTLGRDAAVAAIVAAARQLFHGP